MDIQPRRNLGRVLGMKSHINQLIPSRRLTVGNSFHVTLRMFDVSSINEPRWVFPETQPLTKLICAFISTCFFSSKNQAKYNDPFHYLFVEAWWSQGLGACLRIECPSLGNGRVHVHRVVFLASLHPSLKWVLANLMLGVTLFWTSIPSRGWGGGGEIFLGRFRLQKPG